MRLRKFTNRGYGVKSYGLSRRGVRGNFVPPIRSNSGNAGNLTARIGGKCDDTMEDSTKKCLELLCGPDGELPEKLRILVPHLIEHISNEIMDRNPNVLWDDIGNLLELPFIGFACMKQAGGSKPSFSLRWKASTVGPSRFY